LHCHPVGSEGTERPTVKQKRRGAFDYLGMGEKAVLAADFVPPRRLVL